MRPVHQQPFSALDIFFSLPVSASRDRLHGGLRRVYLQTLRGPTPQASILQIDDVSGWWNRPIKDPGVSFVDQVLVEIGCRQPKSAEDPTCHFTAVSRGFFFRLSFEAKGNTDTCVIDVDRHDATDDLLHDVIQPRVPHDAVRKVDSNLCIPFVSPGAWSEMVAAECWCGDGGGHCEIPFGVGILTHRYDCSEDSVVTPEFFVWRSLSHEARPGREKP